MRHQITTFSAEDNAIQWHYCRFLFAMAATIFLGHIGVERAIAEERAWIPVELKNSGGCYYNLIDNSYNEEAKQLALAVLKQADSGKGCLTFPYRGLPYDLDGRLGLSNEVHAGIDLRAGPVDQIYAIEAGKVAFLNFCTAKDKKRCVTKDDFDHSNLMIENSAKTRRVLYLHMSNIDEKLKVGDDIAAGQTIGIAGNVGATSVHVHIEVWPKDSPHYSTRPTGIAKSACAPKTVCADSDIQKYTLDPFVLVKDAVAEKMAECKEAVVTDGISGFEAQLALGPALDNNRANAIISLVKGGKFRVPQCGVELGLALTGATEGFRAKAIEALVAVVKSNLSGEEAAAMLGTAKDCTDNNRANAIYYLAAGKKFKPKLSGKELEMILDGTTGGFRAKAIEAIANAGK